MITKQCISITDLKRDASKHIKSLKTEWSKVIFINNKPVAILSDIDNFDLHIDEPFDFKFDVPVDPKEILSHFWRE